MLVFKLHIILAQTLNKRNSLLTSRIVAKSCKLKVFDIISDKLIKYRINHIWGNHRESDLQLKRINI